MTASPEEPIAASRPDLVAKLVLSAHLDAAERRQLVPAEVLFDEVLGVVQAYLAHNRYFPPGAVPKEPPYEGGIFENLPSRHVRLHWQHHYPWSLDIEEYTCKDYRRLADALREFIRWQWPNGIDGVRIEDPVRRLPWWRKLLRRSGL